MREVVGWSAADGSGREAAPVRCDDASVVGLTRALAAAKASSPANCTFWILEVADRGEGWLERTCEVAGQMALDRRVVVSVRPSDLARAGRRLPWPSRVGLLLEVQDARVRFQDFLDDRLDGVRFAVKFVDAAERDLRTGSVLDAMLRLVRALGVATLGPDPESRLGPWLTEAVFDYVEASVRSIGSTSDRPSQFGFELSR